MLPPKRKKNVKIDSTEKFEVIDTEDLDPLYLDEFTLPPIDSGMEAEEEKEVHLKKIIEQKTGEIPVPVIFETENLFVKKYIHPETYVKYHKDVNIEYCKSEEDKNLMLSYNINEEEYNLIIQHIKKEIDGSKRVSSEDNILYENEVYKTVYDAIKYKFLLREDLNESSSYVCFRKRIIKPSRKNRRSETQAKEKISRLYTEFNLIQTMCDLSKKKHEIDNEILKNDLEIINKVNEITSKYENTKNKIRNVLNCKERTKKNFVLQGDIFHNILYNRDNIKALKRKLNSKLTFNDEDIKKEWIAYQKYKSDEL